MRRNGWSFVILVAFFALASAACSGQEEPATPTTASPTSQAAESPTESPPTATPLTEPEFLLARVESLEIVSDDAEGTDVAVRLRGVLSNNCSQVDKVVTELNNDEFTIAVLEVQNPPGQNEECDAAEIPFDQTVDLVDIAPGSYTVSAHGLQGTFTVAGEPNPTPDATPTNSAPITGSISGIIWHDVCEGTVSSQELPPPGCASDNDDGLQADGQLADEPGIAGVRVEIGAGDCDSPATDFVISDADGKFIFDDLPAGQYCISIDETNPQNADVLLTGVWTSPSSGMAEQSVSLEGTSEEQVVNFGWDFAFLPLGDFDPETCENSFAYLEDVNIPDDTEFAPNQVFTKRWLLQNNGSCPWTDEYSVVFVGGDQMAADDAIPLTRPVVPGQTVEVAVDMIAPAEPGSYRGNWQIANADGDPFGIDGFIEDAFWLRIVVVEGATPSATAASDSGTIGGVVWDDLCTNDDPGSNCIEFPEGSGLYVGDGAFGPQEEALAGITISLASSSCPSDGTLPPDDSVLATAVTSDDGRYQFSNLESGMYCIFMDALAEENVDLLIPGNWTWPATGVGRYTFFLDPGEQALDLDFGWDYVE